MSFTINTTVSASRVCDMIVGAFEGGSNYWLGRGRVELVEPAYDSLPQDGIWYGHPELYEGQFKITIDVPDDELRTLDNEAVRKGLEQMASLAGNHFGDLMQETDDAETADVFLQLCLFGEIVYG